MRSDAVERMRFGFLSEATVVIMGTGESKAKVESKKQSTKQSTDSGEQQDPESVPAPVPAVRTVVAKKGDLHEGE